MENSTFLNKKLVTRKTKLITSSTLWAGLGFLVVGILCIAFSFIIKESLKNNFDNNYFIISGVVSIVGLIIAMVFEFRWSFNIHNSSWGTIITAITCNILAYTLIIAPWVVLIQDSWVITTAIAITGLSFVVMAMIGTFISDKAAFSMMKIVGILTLVFFVFQLAFIFILVFAWRSYEMWQLIYNALFILILVPYIVLSFWQISKTELFYGELDDAAQRRKVSLFFGLIILKQFISLLMIIVRMLAWARR